MMKTRQAPGGAGLAALCRTERRGQMLIIGTVCVGLVICALAALAAVRTGLPADALPDSEYYVPPGSNSVSAFFAARRAARAARPVRHAHARWLNRLEAYYDSVREENFHRIYHTNTWGANETRAGPGSTVAYTANARRFLADVIHDLNIHSMADLSCSEMNWQHLIEGFDALDEFVGYDIVAETVGRNAARFAHSRNVKFEVRDMVRQPLDRPFDLVLVRDTLFHLPLSDVMTVLSAIEDSGSKYLATTYFSGMRGSNCFVGASLTVVVV
jgi:hypothetical protein